MHMAASGHDENYIGKCQELMKWQTVNGRVRNDFPYVHLSVIDAVEEFYTKVCENHSASSATVLLLARNI